MSKLTFYWVTMYTWLLLLQFGHTVTGEPGYRN